VAPSVRKMAKEGKGEDRSSVFPRIGDPATKPKSLDPKRGGEQQAGIAK